MAEVTYSELPEGTDDENVVKPVALAKELGIAPQIVYSYIRTGGLPAYTKGGEGRYILRDEFKAWQEAKEQKKMEREQKKAEKAAAKAAKEEAKAAAGEAASEDESEDELV